MATAFAAACSLLMALSLLTSPAFGLWIFYTPPNGPQQPPVIALYGNNVSPALTARVPTIQIRGFGSQYRGLLYSLIILDSKSLSCAGYINYWVSNIPAGSYGILDRGKLLLDYVSPANTPHLASDSSHHMWDAYLFPQQGSAINAPPATRYFTTVSELQREYKLGQPGEHDYFTSY